MTTLRAAVFINWSMPLRAGHVGWGFESAKDRWFYGSVEVTDSAIIAKGDNNKTFNSGWVPEKTMLDNMKTGRHAGSNFRYHEYKYINVINPSPQSALNLIEGIIKNGYGFFGNNCMDAVFNVIKTYARGNDKILPWPATHWTPRSFYTAIPSSTHVLQTEAATR